MTSLGDWQVLSLQSQHVARSSQGRRSCITVTFVNNSAGWMSTEARGNYLPEPPYLRETDTYHSQPLESIRHAGNYFVPLSVRPIFIFLLQKLCQITWLLTGWEKFLYFRRPPEAWGRWLATSAIWLIRHWLRHWTESYIRRFHWMYVGGRYPCCVPPSVPGTVAERVRQIYQCIVGGLLMWCR